MTRAHRVVACGAGFAGDRADPALALAESGEVYAGLHWQKAATWVLLDLELD